MRGGSGTGPGHYRPGVATLSVTHDEPAGGRAGRSRSVSLRLDGSPWLRTTPYELLELGIADGDSLDAEAVAAVETELARTRARLFVVRSLAARPQSVSEIEAKLAARGVAPELAAEAVALALDYGYLDDASLAAQLARGHVARGYGRRRAAQALRTRGLPQALAEHALEEAYDGDEVEQALAALGRRAFGEGDGARRKAVAFLARRGFSPAASWAAVKRREPTPGDGGTMGT
jgi:regulatory protein